MKSSKMFATLAALGLVFSLLAAEAQAVPVVNTGFNAAANLKGEVLFTNFTSAGGGTEISVKGTGSAATGDVVWGFPAGTKAVSFSYNGVGALSATVAGSSPASISKTGLTIGTVNYLEIEITKHNSTGSVSLNTVLLDTDSLGNFTVPNNPTVTRWNVTGVDLTSGFTLTGVIAVGTQLGGGGGSNNVKISVGYLAPPADTEAPIVTNVAVTPVPVLINGQATVTATVDDTTTGNGNIKSAEYSLNGGAWTAMGAQDGAFDEVAENVVATFTAYVLGTNEVCVRGTDDLDNISDGTDCQTFLVTYKFDGFFSPIENDFMNASKAGQAVPTKWRLTDANDVPIGDPASFAGLYAYPISCTDYQGEILDSIEEIAAGGSGLQYSGDGYWQFNWKTPKTYANTCQAMYVMFNSGALSPVVKFQFKK